MSGALREIIQVMKLFVSLILGLFAFFGILGVGFGESYPNGAEGIKGATLPPPGIYYRMTNMYINADKLVDPNGNEIGDFDANIFATVQRLIWITQDIKIFGADYAFQFLLPICYKHIEMGHYSESQWALGDFIFEPFMLAWHEPRYDVILAAAFFLPTVDHKDPVDPGEGMFTTMLTLGVTYHLDKERTWAASILGRYEIHHDEYRDTNIIPGNDFHFEWAISRTLAQIWDIGIVGYCQWQVTEDSGSMSTDDKDRCFAVGPEISVFYPPMKTFFSLRSLFEFSIEGDATGRAEGNRTVFTITKLF